MPRLRVAGAVLSSVPQMPIRMDGVGAGMEDSFPQRRAAGKSISPRGASRSSEPSHNPPCYQLARGVPEKSRQKRQDLKTPKRKRGQLIASLALRTGAFILVFSGVNQWIGVERQRHDIITDDLGLPLSMTGRA